MIETLSIPSKAAWRDRERQKLAHHEAGHVADIFDAQEFYWLRGISLPPPRHASVFVTAVTLNAMVHALGLLLSSLLFGLAGCVASIYVACRWQPTRGALWLCAYTVGGTGLLMLAGFGLRCLVGDRAVFGGDHAPNGLPCEYVALWPALFFAVSGYYMGLIRQARFPSPRNVRNKRAW